MPSATARADVRLDSTGDLPAVGALVDRAELVAQRITVRLRTWRGEWLLDAQAGIPYRELLQAKPFPADLVATLIRREIDQTPGVVRVRSTGSSFNPETRAAAFTFEVVVSDGTVLTVETSPTLITRGNRVAGALSRSGVLVRIA